MPHFKDGSEAKVGDRCRFKVTEYDRATNQNVVAMREGLIYQINPGATSCNAQVAYPMLETVESDGGKAHLVRLSNAWVTLGEVEKAG